MSVTKASLIRVGLVQVGLVHKLSATSTTETCRYYYNFDGQDDYGSLPRQAVNAGDKISVQFEAPSVAAERYLFAAGSAESVCGMNADGTWKITGLTSVLIDGSSIVDGVTLFPIDSANHTLTAEVSTFEALERIASNFAGTANYIGKIWNLVVTTSGDVPIVSYALDDNSTVLVDNVSGKNGTLINGTADQWEKVCSSAAFGDEFGSEFN